MPRSERVLPRCAPLADGDRKLSSYEVHLPYPGAPPEFPPARRKPHTPDPAARRDVPRTQHQITRWHTTRQTDKSKHVA
jgi:hypothetical protein